jgi:hypothetical protein
MFADAKVDVFACTHTCVPALRSFDFGRGMGVVANNGAAGMPNFTGARHGLITRIGVRPFAGRERIYGTQVQGAAIEALRLEYDHQRWVERFLAHWPAGSPAHASYFRRIAEGPRFTEREAAPVLARAL